MVKSRLRVAVGVVVVVGGIAGVLAAQAPASAAFEVASVKISPPGIGSGIQWGRNTWSAGPMGLGALLALAFDVHHIIGLPSWNATEDYRVDAKAEDGVLLTRENLRPRLQQLLVERFKLVAHIETQAVSGYALVLARGGPKLKETTEPLAMTAIGIGRVRAPSITMDVLASALGNGPGLVGQPVANETGLAGNYDFTLTFAPEGATDLALPSIFTALEEQLGLKLEGGRKVPVNTLVIDHVEHPTPD